MTTLLLIARLTAVAGVLAAEPASRARAQRANPTAFPSPNSRARAQPANPAASPSPAPWPSEARSYRFHMIGNAHIDPVWLWPSSEGRAVVLSTFRSALDRMKETPGFTFTASSAQFYEWVAEADPAMLKEIRRRVDEGRWAVVGGWWVEPDINIPSGEALARHGLLGQRTLERLVGQRAHVGYNPDSFGHPATLPQILAQQELEAYVMMRPQPHEKTLPASLFLWESPDGTRLPTYRIPFAYNDGGPSVDKRLRDIVTRLGDPARSLMVFYGVGDHGGGPTKKIIRSIVELPQQEGAPAAVFSTPERYFDEQAAVVKSAPVVRDELQHHAVGCYTAEWTVKHGNRRAEILLLTGEKLAALGAAVAGLSYPREALADGWKRVLFQQFHDILAGTALPEHYTRARDAHGFAAEVATQAMHRAAQTIAWQIPTPDPESQYLVVFNPHAWPATLDAEYDLGFFSAPDRGGTRLEADGLAAPVPHQWTAASTETNGRRKLLFRAELPAFGYRQFRLRAAGEGTGTTTAGEGEAAAAAAATKAGARAADRTLENQHLRLTFATDGSFAIFDKDAGHEVLRAPRGRAVVIDDPSDTWSHAVKSYTREVGAFGGAQVTVLEPGPQRARLRVRTRWGASTLEIDWALWADSRRVEADVTLDWHEQRKMLKLSFPVDVTAPRPTYEVAFGHLERLAEGEEDPGHRWVDLSGRRGDGVYGLAVINDAKYGYSAHGSDVRISVARAAVYAHHDPRKLEDGKPYLWQDQGRQRFRMVLLPHAGTWQRAGVPRLAEEVTTPVPIVYQGAHAGTRPASASFLSVDAPNVIVSAVKRPEDERDGALIVRLFETDGRPAEVNLALPLAGRTWRGQLRAAEIKTLRVPTGRAPIRAVNLLER